MHNKFITVKTKAFGKEFVHPDNNGKLLSNTQILTSSKYINASKDKEFADMIRKDKMTGIGDCLRTASESAAGNCQSSCCTANRNCVSSLLQSAGSNI